ncbi:hypothetical protein BDV35DRAFT_362669 [Aspergillus flavus]|uniref:Uncharacterized protein n=1 Tax=Aspergillus flavus TaxID=5059 RepID=A0A5N6GT63_ASPFL|nr:hypothetical protein BDV35DRAFT_362669 [Aspergillus flavus]
MMRMEIFQWMCGTIRALTRDRLSLWLRRFCGANCFLLLQSTSASSSLSPSGLTRRNLVLCPLVIMAVVCNGLASLVYTYIVHRI